MNTNQLTAEQVRQAKVKKIFQVMGILAPRHECRIGFGICLARKCQPFIAQHSIFDSDPRQSVLHYL